MGGGLTKDFVVREDVAGQGSLAMEVFQQLMLKKENINALHKAFVEMDSDGSQKIRRDMICSYFKVEKTPLSIKITKVMETEEYGYMNFCEMVAFLWDFLSREPKSLGSFVFDVFDRGRRGYLYRNELLDLVAEVHHTNASNHGVQKMVHELLAKTAKGPKLSAKQFDEYCRDHNDVCAPLIALQNVMRERMLGKKTWQNLACQRQASKEMLHSNYIQDLISSKKRSYKKQAKKSDVKYQPSRELKHDKKRPSAMDFDSDTDDDDSPVSVA